MNNSSGRNKKSIGSTILTIVLLLAYFALKPKIDAWLGNEKPDANQPAVVEKTNDDAKPVVLDAGNSETTQTGAEKSVAAKKPSEAKPLPRIATPPPAKTEKKTASTPKPTQRKPTKPTTSSGDVLTKVGREYRSKAGLVYGPGKEHRRDHVLRHARDDTSKPVHGVFDDESKVFALVDEAYEKVKSRSKDVKTRKEGQRVSHEVNMRRRIGYKGGRSGKQRGNPPLSKIKLILVEGNRVITAYPY